MHPVYHIPEEPKLEVQAPVHSSSYPWLFFNRYTYVKIDYALSL
jgi:hypothetical protein